MTTNTKNKWFGRCGLCGRNDQSLATSITKTGMNLNYTVLRACDDCSFLIHQRIEEILSLIIKARPKEKEEEKK